MRIIGIYPGRFHPYHKGHAASFKQLAQKFGLDNTYLAISAKQEQPKSPFSAQDRAKMAMALGIPAKNIIAVRNPYVAQEYIDQLNLDPEKTAIVFGVSKKDMEGDPAMGIAPDPRFSFAPKRDGSPSYLQPFNPKKVDPMTQHGYVMSTDVAEFPIAGKQMRDASAIRKAYAGADDKTKMRILRDLYGDAADKMKQVFDNNLQVTESIRRLIAQIKPVLSEATVEQKARFVKLLSEAKARLSEDAPTSEFYVRKITENKVVDYVRKSMIPEMRRCGVPISQENHYPRLTSAVFEGVSKMVESGKEFIEQFKKLDQRREIPINVGTAVSILNLRLSQDFAELFGFSKPKTITKIYREPTDNKIIQLEFNNDPEDVWPRQPLASYNGNLLFDSILLKDENSVDKAIMLLNLYKPESIRMRVSVTENIDRDQSARGNVYSKGQAAIIQDLGNGYFLGDDSYDDDEGFTKEGYSVYFQEGPNEFRHVGHVQMSPYQNEPGAVDASIQQLIQQDQPLDEEDQSGIEHAYNDPETHSIMAYARQHYPEEPDLQAAFVKFVLRSLKHSKEDDSRQDNEIELLLKRVNALQDTVDKLKDKPVEKVSESQDYLEEK